MSPPHFNPRAPYGARRGAHNAVHCAALISIHAPHTGRDVLFPVPDALSHDFNPRAPYGARPFVAWPAYNLPDFNPRAPYGARPLPDYRQRIGLLFQSTRPIRGATAGFQQLVHGHAISIHAPHTGRDRWGIRTQQRQQEFQSTRPIRGATIRYPGSPRCKRYFNPRAPYGARRETLSKWRVIPAFQSTRPIRGATPHCPVLFPGSLCISIHAPHTGRDAAISGISPARTISIHAPHTGRDAKEEPPAVCSCTFQSTRPIRGATARCSGRSRELLFQSTRPIRGATLPRVASSAAMLFQSTRPIRGATLKALETQKTEAISIHAPHTGRDEEK